MLVSSFSFFALNVITLQAIKNKVLTTYTSGTYFYECFT